MYINQDDAKYVWVSLLEKVGGDKVIYNRKVVCILLFLGIFLPGIFVHADSVGQSQVTKFFAPETIQMLLDRTNNGNPGIQPGDTLSYIIESIPVDDGGTQGVNGYITDYVPLGLEVIGASFVSRVPSPGKPGGFDYVDKAINPAGLMQAGVGKRGAIYAGLLPFDDGALPEGSQDTGIFFSTDPRTAYRSGAGVLPYTVGALGAGCTGAGFLPSTYYVYNDWDYAQFLAFGCKTTALGAALAAPRGAGGTQPIVNLGVGLGWAGLGSPVAGPLTYYTNDYNPGLLAVLPPTAVGFIAPITALPYSGVGPWQRISYFGSRMGGSGLVAPALIPGAGAVTAGVNNSIPTSAGYFLSAGNPLPYNPLVTTIAALRNPLTTGHTNAVRWAFGQRMVGTIERVKISFRVKSIANFGSPGVDFQNHSSVFGGDITAPGAGKDLTYKYLAPTQSVSDARIMLIKQVVAVKIVPAPAPPASPWRPTDGATLAPTDIVKYRITYLNATATSLSGFTLHDIPDSLAGQTCALLTATSGTPFLATPVVSAVNPGGIDWLPAPLSAGSVLAPGEGGFVELECTVGAGGAGTVVTNTALASSTLPVVDAYSYAPSSIFAIPPASLSQSKTVTPLAVVAGGQVKYSIVVSSTGGALDSGVTGGGVQGSAAVGVPNFYPGGLGEALVVGDNLDPNFTYVSTARVALRDRITGVVYPYAALDPYTVPLGPAVLPITGVFWTFSGYPASYPLPAPLPTAANYLTGVDFLIDFYASANALAPPGRYFNGLESYVSDPTQGNDIAWVNSGLAPVTVTSVTGFPDLLFTKNDVDINGAQLNPGDLLRYDLSLTNKLTSGVAATTPIITDPIPGGTHFVTGSATTLPVAGPIVSYSNNYGISYLYVPPGVVGTIDPYVTNIKFDYTATGLAIGATATGSFQIQIPTTFSHGVIVSNQAVLDAYSGVTPFQLVSDDPITAALSDPTKSTIAAPSDFTTSTKTVTGNTGGAGKANVGDTLTYTIAVNNTGFHASNVTVTDTIDLTKFTFGALAALPPNWSVTGPDVNGKITWSNANFDAPLAPATVNTAVLQFTAIVKVIPDGSAIDNAAVIASNESLPHTINAPTLTTPVTLINGTVFNDSNNDGLIAGEVGVAGVTVSLRSTAAGADVASVTTDVNGLYSLTVPAVADWYVQVTDTANILNGYTLTTTQPLVVTAVANSTVSNQDFGYYLGTPPATINGVISSATSASGFHPNVTIDLKNSAGVVVGSGVTDSYGFYSFTGLAPGNYIVEITDTAAVLANEYLTSPSPSPVAITGLTAGTTYPQNFAYNTGSRIGDIVFDDANNNALYDPLTDSGIAGVTLELQQAGVTFNGFTAVTDGNGAYTFQGVPPGTYNVVITDVAAVLTGFVSTTPTIVSPHAVSTSSGVDNLAVDFGYNAIPAIITTKTVNKGVAGFNEAVQYTITVKNTGGTAANFIVRDILPTPTPPTVAVTAPVTPPYTPSANTFLYLSTDSVTMNGSAFTIPTQPIANSSQPTWSGFTMPAAGILKIVFTAFTGANQGVNYNGVHTEFDNTPGVLPVATVQDFPDLAQVTISNAGTMNKRVQAINGALWAAGTPTVVAGDKITYAVTLENSSAALTQNLQSIIETMPIGFTYAAGSAMLTSPYNQPVGAIVPVQVGQQLTWSFAGPLFPATAAAFPSVATLTFDLYANGIAGTYTDKADMNITVGAGLTTVPLSSGDTAPVILAQPNLSLTKTSSTPLLSKDGAGNFPNASYTATVTNSGGAIATGVVLTDTLPTGFTYAAGTGTVSINGVIQAAGTVSFSQTGQLLTITTNPVGGFTVPANNGTLVIRYSSSIANTTAFGAAVNTIVLASTNATAPAAANSSIELTAIQLSKTTATAAVSKGGVADYTITFNNGGATILNNISIADTLPTGFTYKAGSSIINGVVAADPYGTVQAPTWTLAPIAIGAAATITFSANVDINAIPGTYLNSVQASDALGTAFPNPGPTAPVIVQDAQPSLSFSKTVTVISDPVNLTTNPLSIPGAELLYRLQVNNSGTGTVDADTIVMIDPINTNIALVVTDINGAGTGPVGFTDNPNGTGASGLTYTFTALNDALDDVSFSNDGGATYTYTPTPDANGVDTTVTHIKIAPKGIMAANTGAGNTNFELRFKVKVK